MKPSLIVVIATVVLLAGCGGPVVITSGEPVPSPYAGPMHLPMDYSDDASVLERSGAAGRALQCDGSPYAGGGADYESGLASVQDSATAALENLFDQPFSARVPRSGYRVERRDGGRVLFSYDVDGRTKAAFIAAEGIRDFSGDVGWGIESWAGCDPSELPASVTEDFVLEVWQDSSGQRVPVTTIRSFPGAEHCDWQDITFLLLGPEGEAQWYVRAPGGQFSPGLLRTTFDGSATLPEGATSTGFHRDGRELWLGPDHDAAYLVSLDDPTDVERWPAAKRPIRCA